jgi:hypothetical protein
MFGHKPRDHVAAYMKNRIRRLPLPTPSPSTEPDAVPEGHERCWFVGLPNNGHRSEESVRARLPDYPDATCVYYVDIPKRVTPTVRGAVVGGAR